MLQDFSSKPQHSSSPFPFCPINLFSDINQHHEDSILLFSPNRLMQCLLISFLVYSKVCHPNLFLDYILSILAPTLPFQFSRTFWTYCDLTTTKLFLFVVLNHFLFPQGALLSFVSLTSVYFLCLGSLSPLPYCVCQGVVRCYCLSEASSNLSLASIHSFRKYQLYVVYPPPRLLSCLTLYGTLGMGFCLLFLNPQLLILNNAVYINRKNEYQESFCKSNKNCQFVWNLCFISQPNESGRGKYSLNANHVVFVKFYLPRSHLILSKCLKKKKEWTALGSQSNHE